MRTTGCGCVMKTDECLACASRTGSRDIVRIKLTFDKATKADKVFKREQSCHKGLVQES